MLRTNSRHSSGKFTASVVILVLYHALKILLSLKVFHKFSMDFTFTAMTVRLFAAVQRREERKKDNTKEIRRTNQDQQTSE